MALSLIQKKLVVQSLVTKFRSAASIVVVEYNKATVADLTLLRQDFLLPHNIIFKVYKNRLVKIAARKSGFTTFSDHNLTGHNAFAFADDNPLQNLKLLAQFIKSNKVIKIKHALYNGKLLTALEANELALLPTKDELIVMFAVSLKNIIQKFVIAISQINKTQYQK